MFTLTSSQTIIRPWPSVFENSNLLMPKHLLIPEKIDPDVGFGLDKWKSGAKKVS